MSEPRTITFQPEQDVRSLLGKVFSDRKGVRKSYLINEALRSYFKKYAGKRELPEKNFVVAR